MAVLRILGEAGATPGVADRQGVLPLAHARSRGYVEMVRILERAAPR